MTHYAEEMNRLQRTLLAMAAHAEGAVTQAMSALLGANPELAHQVIRDDGILDQFEIEIDEIAIHLLTKAPLAADLRFVTAAMKISTNLERVGDEAVTMSRRIIDLATEPQLRTPSDLGRMADMALEMLRDAMGAFVRRQPAEARTVLPLDAEVDALNRQIHRELSQVIVERPAGISRCLNLMVVSKSLERIADHATNVAEEVVYLYEAVDIRHSDLKAART
jgi:phosphate transport system protein